MSRRENFAHFTVAEELVLKISMITIQNEIAQILYGGVPLATICPR